MHELRDEELILYFYGESRHTEEIRRRLDASANERERYDELCRLLQLVETQPVPEPHADYGARVWRRLKPRLDEPGPAGRVREWLRALLAPRRLAAVGAVAMLLALAFTAGRFWPAASGEPGQPLPEAGRQRILLVAVGEHLERSEMLLVELANAPREGALDAVGEPRRAEELLSSNRLYRRAARRSGQGALAEVLEELERLLLDVAHLDAGGGELSAVDLDALQERIESGGVLFKVQVVGSRLQRQTQRQNQRQNQLNSAPPDSSGEV